MILIVGLRLHKCLLLTAHAPDFPPEKTSRRQSGGLIQPAGQNGFIGNAPGLLCEDDKHRLRDLFDGVNVAGLPQRGEINQIYMALNQRGKGRMGVFHGELPQ